jgi:acetylornithine deacetylase
VFAAGLEALDELARERHGAPFAELPGESQDELLRACEHGELDRELAERPAHPLLGRGSVHASTVEGGQEFSSYPARCVVTGERRTLPGETVAQVERELRRLSADHADVRIGVSREPFEGDADEPFAALVRHCAAVDDVVGVPFWADSALIAATAIPTVLYGPSGDGAHAVEEWVDLDSLARVRDVVLDVAVEWCG